MVEKKVLDNGRTIVMDDNLGILLKKGDIKLGVLLIGSISERDGAKLYPARV